jgi:isopentenyldiphosphate isomerase
MSYLERIRACNRWDPSHFVPFRMDGEQVGLIRPEFAHHLRQWPKLFRVERDAVTWAADAFRRFEDRTAALQEVLEHLAEQGAVAYLHGEMYPVTRGNRLSARFLIDRACAPYFGVRAFGQHMNGYVSDGDGLKLWVGKRAANRKVYPLHWDNLVAGGLPWGVTLADNLRKECREEADIPVELADRAVGVGAVTYCRESDGGLKPDVMYCYDLELPMDFQPCCNDGEVEAFYLWPIEQVMDVVRDSEEFKLNCNLVIIDFLVRHGYLDQDAPDYLAIVQGLRSPLP